MLLTALHYIAQLVSAQHCTSIPSIPPQLQMPTQPGPAAPVLEGTGTREMEQRREVGGSVCDAHLLGTL